MKRFYIAFLCLLTLVIFAACGENNEADTTAQDSVQEIQEQESADPEEIPAKEEAELPSEDLDKEQLLASLMESMTLEEKIGQMLFCSFELDEAGGGLLTLDDKTRSAMAAYQPGGIIYFASNIDTAEQTLALSKEFQDTAKIPLFIATDEEGGRVSRITRSGNIDAVKIPPMKQIGLTGDPQNAYKVNDVIAKELKALGINTDFAPCADVDQRDDGAIGDRSFSGNAETAASFVVEAVRAFQENQVVSAVKHFPGHGAALGDTHEEAIVAEKTLEEILAADMLPFARGAEAGVPMIMVSHITVSEWGEPSSVSKAAMDYIRNDLAYDGIIITDSFKMGAITHYYEPGEAAKRTIAAGTDILLMPEDLDAAFTAVLAAVSSGEIPPEQIDQSVKRILSLKFDYGFFNQEAADIETTIKHLDSKMYEKALEGIF